MSVTFVAGLLVVWTVVSGVPPIPDKTVRPPEKPEETVRPESREEDPVLAAIDIVRTGRHKFPPDVTFLEAWKLCLRAENPRVAPVLVEMITFHIPDPPKPSGSYSEKFRETWEVNKVVPALIEIGEPAVPPIISALAWLVVEDPRSARAYLLMNTFAAILGPFEGVKRLREEMARVEDQRMRVLLKLVLRKFRDFSYVPRWFPEGEGSQRFVGNVREELEKHPELWKDADSGDSH